MNLKVQNYSMKIFFQKFFLSQAIPYEKTMIFIPTFAPHDFFGAFYGHFRVFYGHFGLILGSFRAHLGPLFGPEMRFYMVIMICWYK